MIFKIGNLKFCLSFTFIAVILFVLLNKRFSFLGVSLVCSLCHELVHILFLLIFRCKIEEIKLTIFGADIKRKAQSVTTCFKEAIIHLSAPLFNIFWGIIILKTDNQNHWGYVNLFIGLFNIAPFFNFDGGAGLCFILSYFFENSAVERIITATSCLIVVMFTCFDLWVSLKKGINISFILINMYFTALLVYRLYKKHSDIA